LATENARRLPNGKKGKSGGRLANVVIIKTVGEKGIPRESAVSMSYREVLSKTKGEGRRERPKTLFGRKKKIFRGQHCHPKTSQVGLSVTSRKSREVLGRKAITSYRRRKEVGGGGKIPLHLQACKTAPQNPP